MTKTVRLRTAMILILLSPWVGAQKMLPQAFQLKAGPIAYLENNQVFSVWNANNQSKVLQPGMKVLFFGRGEGCDLHASNGPVVATGSPLLDQARDLTGIPLARSVEGRSWIPSGNTEQCRQDIQNQVGDSFVHVNENPKIGGIGIYTSTGPDQDGREYFFRQFDQRGWNGTGANANIEGTFVAIRFDWQKEGALRPWAGNYELPSQRGTEFRTVQTVASASVGTQDAQEVGGAVQVKQQMNVSLINVACRHEAAPNKRLCQLQYLFHTAIYRAGVTDWSGVQWFKSAGLLLDPGQGGMPVIHGPVGRSGEISKDQRSGLELYTSFGEATHHDLFSDKTFRIRVTFDQFKNALKVISGAQLKKPPGRVTSGDLISMYGVQWDNPDEWVLLSVNVGQEVRNPSDLLPAHIGGGVKELAVVPAP